jgi:charged multivesicular body protein 6
LKQQRDRLNQNRRRIESQLERERDVAKQLLKNGQKE